MKKSVLHSAFLALIGLVLSPMAVSAASSPPADSVHFCAFDHEQWRRDHPRPAAKPLGDLNAGEPRTVRMIYFLPSDRPFRQEMVDSMKVVMRRVQTFYAEQMQANGYGDRTFQFETDAQGEPLVHRVDGHNENPSRVIDELGQAFDLDANVYLIGAAINYHAAFGVRQGKNGGFVFVEDEALSFRLVAHELGHAFGLRHDFSDGAYLMSYGPGRYQLSACHAEFLAVHPYFNPDTPTGEGPPPTLDLLSPRTYPAESLSVAVRLNISASAGLHQVFLLVDGPQGLEVKACRSMAGDKDPSVAFSRDGLLLAVATIEKAEGMGSTVRLWDVVTHERMAAFGHRDVIWSVAFSPDEATLASGSKDGTILLWDVSPFITPQTPDPDFDGDGTVGFGDFVIFAARFGLSQGDAGYDARYDLDGDGTIGFGDFVIFANNFGLSAVTGTAQAGKKTSSN